MNPFEFALLADENIHPKLIQILHENGHDILSVHDLELAGHPDTKILAAALQNSRVVLTHDSDFGWLAIAQGQPLIGVIYLRPGHIKPEFSFETIQAIKQKDLDVRSPFIIVAERLNTKINIRIRQI